MRLLLINGNTKRRQERRPVGWYNHANLEAEVAQSTAQVIVDGDRLRLQQLAVGQQHPRFLAA